MSNSKMMHAEFQRRMRKRINQEQYEEHTKIVRQKILEHKYLGSNTRVKEEEVNDK